MLFFHKNDILNIYKYIEPEFGYYNGVNAEYLSLISTIVDCLLLYA